jgi:transcriptional regulator with XRE-family HTH domain
MAIGERIKHIRNLRKITQRELGLAIGFDENTADVRVAQYETGTRTPKSDLTNTIAAILDVSPHTLDVPDIDSDIGLMHTLFALEDLRGLHVSEIDGELCLRLDKGKGRIYDDILAMFSAWREQAAKLETGGISKEEYDRWRYNYPKFDTAQRWVKVPPQELSDFIADAFKDGSKTD